MPTREECFELFGTVALQIIEANARRDAAMLIQSARSPQNHAERLATITNECS
ncbi:hypothetical protein [Microbacterium azadirachtae]|uniref:hypothetical protein n=1 Tax=Microbacterium azadirachtae TaxID=582680 RepID=UPI0015872741|nr:hypothetical protein [Microbacterium azadirachtae]